MYKHFDEVFSPGQVVLDDQSIQALDMVAKRKQIVPGYLSVVGGVAWYGKVSPHVLQGVGV